MEILNNQFRSILCLHVCVAPTLRGRPAVFVAANVFLESARKDGSSFLNYCISTFVYRHARERLYSPDKSTVLALNKSLCGKSGHSYKAETLTRRQR